MRIYERNLLTEYLYHGVFYTTEAEESNETGDILDDERTVDDIVFNDGDIDPDYKEDSSDNGSGETVENIVMEVECDILQASKMFASGVIQGDYDVYFHTLPGQKLPIRSSMMFRCEDFPIPINGMVVGIDPTQLGVKVQVKISEA